MKTLILLILGYVSHAGLPDDQSRPIYKSALQCKTLHILSHIRVRTTSVDDALKTKSIVGL